MSEDKKRIYVLYARQSISRLSDESLSIEFQIQECTTYITQRGGIIAGTFTDPDTKGWKRNRPGFDAMLDTIRSGQAQVVCLYKLSRFARNLMMQEEVVTQIADAGGELVSITEPHITTSPMIRQILGAVNENFRRDQSDWLSSTFAARARRGLPHGYAPFGYRKEDKRLLIDDDTGPVARLIWEWAIDGEGTVEITYRLNERGIATLRGKEWQPVAVLGILRNPLYAGHVQHRGEVVARDTHPAIVTDAEFATVQQSINRRSNHRRKAEPSWAEGYVYHSCGERMYLAGWHRKDGRSSPRFRCHRAFATKRRGEIPCTERPASIFASFAEEHIVDQLGTLLDRIVSPEAVALALEASYGESAKVRERHRASLERRLADLKRQRDRLLDLVLQTKIDADMYGDRDTALKAEIATLSADLDAVPEPVSIDAVRRTHQQITDVLASVAIVAAQEPSALVRILSALDARLIIGEGGPRLDVGPALSAYVRSR